MGLVETDHKDTFILLKDFVTYKVGGIPKRKTTNTIKAGKYISTYKDKEGTYYNGPQYCWKSHTLKDITAHCGIFIPHSKLDSYKLYYYPNSVKRVEDNISGNEITQDVFGPGGAALFLALDPYIAIEQELDSSIRLSIQK